MAKNILPVKYPRITCHQSMEVYYLSWRVSLAQKNGFIPILL